MRTKKILSLIIALMLVLSVFVIPASADGVVIAISDADVNVGGEVSVDVKVTGSISLAGIKIAYDDSKLTFDGFTVKNSSAFELTADETGYITIERKETTALVKNVFNPETGEITPEVPSDLVVANLKFVACAADALSQPTAEVTLDASMMANEVASGTEDYLYDDAGANIAGYSPVDGIVTIKKPHTAPVAKGEIAITGDGYAAGEAQIGKELTAALEIEDNWDLEAATEYAWTGEGVDATGATWTPAAADFGKTITVTATPKVLAGESGAPADTLTGTPVTATFEVVADPAVRASVVAESIGFDGNVIVSKPATVVWEIETDNGYDSDKSTVSANMEGAIDSTFAEGKLTVGIKDFQAGTDIVITVTPKGDRDAEAGAPADYTFDCANALAGNMPPVATEQKVVKVVDGVAGTEAVSTAVVGDVLKADYQYSDIADVKNETFVEKKAANFQWYEVVVEEGAITSKTAIEGATAETFEVTKEYKNKTIAVGITPTSEDGMLNENMTNLTEEMLKKGEEVVTAAVTTAANPAFAPKVENVAIASGAIVLNKAFEVKFDYTDGNGFFVDGTESGAVSYKFIKKGEPDGDVTAKFELVDGTTNSFKLSDDTLLGATIYIEVKPLCHADAEGLGYEAGWDAAVKSGDYVPKKQSSGSGAITGPTLGGGGSKPSTPTTSPEPTVSPEPSDAPVVVPAAKDCITLTIGKADVNVFGESKTNDVAPIIRNDRTMLPARLIAEALGATVAWDGEARVVTVTKGDVTIVITIDADKALVNGEEVALDSAAFIESDRTYLPMRFLGEKLGAEVTWNGATQEVYIVPAK